MPATPDEIQISWTNNPPGQVGPRPKRIKVSGTFQFTSPGDAGFTGIEFKQGSPLANGATKVSPGTVVTAAVTGKFKFICHRTVNGVDQVLDPDDPKSGGGGEIEVISE